MNVSDFVNASVLGGTYTLLALSWVVIYQGTRVLNFGIGQLMFFGALMMSTLSLSSLPYGLAIVLAMLGVGVLTGLLYLSMVRPLTGGDAFSSAVLAIGISIMLSAAASVIWGSDLRTLPQPVKLTSVNVLGTRVSSYGLITLGIAAVVVVALIAFQKFTRPGLWMRAAAENPLLASQRGLNVFAIFAGVWFLSGFLAALGGISYATTSVVSPSLTQLALRGIAPALVGGFMSIGGATAGAFAIALIEVVGTRHLGGASEDAVVFASLLVLIAVLPRGIGVKSEARRL
ncbi:MAG TPA: branched-chain amino acid ABC transporter permease [Ilumatobacteraceae bacterium]